MFKALARFFGFTPRPSAPPRRANHAPATPAPSPTPPAPPARHTPSPPAIDRAASPESLCGVTPDMSPEDLRRQLAKLYQRHNRAASSLDPKLRHDAEFMLETIAALREKYSAPPPS